MTGTHLPLVLVPGHMATARSWRLQVEDLGRDRAIVVPEEHVGLPSLREMAGEIARRLPARFDLAGWSMGGYILFELLPLVRERVRRVVFIHTSARPDTRAASAARRVLLRRLRNGEPAAILRRQLLDGLVEPARVAPDFIDEMVGENLRLGLATMAVQIEAMIARIDARPTLGSVACPALVVAGRHDPVASVAAAEEMAALLPRAQLEIFENCGHFSPWEQPAALNARLRAFLAA